MRRSGEDILSVLLGSVVCARDQRSAGTTTYRLSRRPMGAPELREIMNC